MPEKINIDLTARAANHLFGHLLPFWTGPALDEKEGGWVAWMSNELTIDRSQPQGLIVNSRILWAFSAVYRVRPEPIYRQMADRAYQIVMRRFWDTTHGGAFWRLDGAGRVLDDSKKTYGQAFYIYALVEHYQSFHAPQSLQRAIDLFELIERHAHDFHDGGYWEVCQRDWSEALDSRLSDKDQNEKKSMNNHLHVLEAYTNLFRVWKDSRLEQRLRELITLFEHRILDANTHHFNHFFDEHWNLRSDTCTYGHDIEGSWLLCEAAEVLGDPQISRHVNEVAVHMARSVLSEGLAPNGALCYEGKQGKVIDPRFECWPQAEAVIGFINAFQISRDPQFLRAAHRVWDFIEQYLADRVHGEWFWRINTDGRPDPSLPKVSEWKGPYHGTRACLEIMRRLPAI